MLRYRRYTRQPSHWAIGSRYNGIYFNYKHWPKARQWRWSLKLGKFRVEWH